MRKLLIEFDLAGAEWVITAHLAQDPAMIRVFNDRLDPHVTTASLMFALTPEEVMAAEKDGEGSQDTPRQRGKRCNHSFNYGLGYKQFGLRYEIEEAEAKRLRKLYHEQAYPGVSQTYWPWVQRTVRRSGRLENCLGRVRDFYETPSDNLWLQAYAHIPQSTVADVIRRGMVHIYRDEPKAELIAQDHDSVTAQVPADPAYIDGFTRRVIDALSPTLCYGDREFVLGVDAKLGYCRDKKRMMRVEQWLKDGSSLPPP